MATSVQINPSDELCHISKPMPAIKQSVLYTSGKLRREIPSDEDLDSKFLSAKELARALSVEEKDPVENLQNHRAVIKPTKSRRGTAFHSPSPCFGVSQECLAMASACSHDHDYTSLAQDECSPRSDGQEIFRRAAISPAIIIKKRSDDTSISSFGGRHLASNLRSRRIMVGKKSSLDVTNMTSLQRYNGEGKRPTPPERRNANETKNRACAPVSHQIANSDVDSGCELQIPSVSGKEIKETLQMDAISPRPSITPFPPAERRRNRRAKSAVTKNNVFQPANISENAVEVKKEPDEDVFSDPCKASVDSAYNSLSCSSTSKPRTPSENRPPSGGKRSATCGLTSSSSGASSDEWSDIETPRPSVLTNEESSLELVDSKSAVRSEETVLESVKAETVPRTRRISSSKKIRKYSDPSRYTVKEDVNELEKVQYTPTPPSRKPKKGKPYRSVPMKLRALPKSFWEEPNRTNASHYTILPPVQPLFHQLENEDLADIRPVTPPMEKEAVGTRQTISATGSDRPRQCAIIRTGDTDLLLRLFDKVESKRNQTGVRAKRGRPKRPSYCVTPSSRRGQNDNPCVINSITEKLFPKLSLDSRYPIAAMVSSSGMISSTLPVRQTTENSNDDSKVNHMSKVAACANDPPINDNLPEGSPTSSINFAPEMAVDMVSSSSSPTLQPRPSPILPQLVGQKEYSHLLNELAAVL